MTLTAVPQGDFDGAMPLYERAIAIDEKKFQITPASPFGSTTSLCC